MADEQDFTWVDLSGYGMRLLFQRTASGKGIHVVVGGDAHGDALRSLGFVRHDGRGFYVTTKPLSDDFSELLASFPNARTVHTGDALAGGGVATAGTFFFGGVPEAARAAQVSTAEPSKVTVAAPPPAPVPHVAPQVRTYLGLNRIGYKVFSDGTRRFMTDSRGHSTHENDRAGVPPGLLLYGRDEASSLVAAEGFINELMTANLHMGDLRRFVAATHDVSIESVAENDPRLVVAMRTIDVAAASWLCQQPAKTTKTELFGIARRVAEASGFYGELFRSTPQLSDDHLPLPIAVAVQRVLGSDAELKATTVLVEGSTNPAYVSHLPTDSKVAYVDAEDRKLAQLRKTVSSTDITNALPEAVSIEIIDAAPFTLDSPVEYADLLVSRGDQLNLLNRLANRAGDGRSILIQRPGTAAEQVEVEAVRAYIARNYAIEGTVDIDSAIVSGKAGGVPTRIFIVGHRRPEMLPEAPEPAMRLRSVSDWQSLQSWTAEVVSNRQKIADYLASLEDEDSLDESRQSDGKSNTFQAPYISASQSGTATTMVPRNLEGGVRFALNRVLQKANGDVDQFVADKLAVPKEELSRFWSPEQVDAVALSLVAFDRGRGMLIGDQTGIGKGRTLAALMRYGALQGMRVVFMTEAEINFSDIYRDILNTGSADFFSTLIMNNGANCVDENGAETLAATDAQMFKALTKLRHWPDGTRITMHKLHQPYGGSSELFLLGDQPLPEDLEPANIKSTQVWAPNSNLVMASYSQVNRPGDLRRRRRGTKVSDKAAWLRTVVDGNTMLVTDESHNAAGSSSNIGRNMDDIVGKAGIVVYSSATYAKGVRNMRYYRRLLPPTMVTASISETIAKGGETMQETLSAMLVKDGVMVCREHDLSKVTFEARFADKWSERNIAAMDMVAPIMAQMAYLSGDIDERVARLNAAVMGRVMQQNPGEHIHDVRARARSFMVSRAGFGSPLNTVSKLFMSSMLCDATTERAIEALQNGQKPVILLDATVQSVLEDFMESREEGDKSLPTFRNLLHRVLDRLTRVKTPDGYRNFAETAPGLDIMEVMAARSINLNPPGGGGVTRSRALDGLADIAAQMVAEDEDAAPLIHQAHDRLRDIIGRMNAEQEAFTASYGDIMQALPQNPGRVVRQIHALIDNLPDMPISAIDHIKAGIQAAGFSCGEITGRNIEIADGDIVTRRKVAKVEVKNAFNSGALDAVIINRAGATGIDLHASPKFGAQQQRVLIVHELPDDVIKFIQALGRVNRFDQLVGPVVAFMSTGMPAETRILANTNTKLRRMSANTTSNRDSANLFRNIPDIMNAVGDRVVTSYLSARPDLVRTLGLPAFGEQDENDGEERNEANNGEAVEVEVEKRSATMFLARMSCLLSYDQQVLILNELEAEYVAELQELEARGMNPLKTKTINGRVKRVSRAVFSGVDVENPTTEFDRPVFVDTVIIEHAVAPLRSRDVERAYERGLAIMGSDTPDIQAERLRRRRDYHLAMFIPAGATTIDEAVAMGSIGATAMAERFERLTTTLESMMPGTSIQVTIDGNPEPGLVTRVIYPKKAGMDHIASSYDVEVLVPGQSHPYIMNLSSMMRDPAFMTGPRLDSENGDDIRRQFDTALDGTSRERRFLLSGNDWSAMSLAIKNRLGVMTTYVDEAGVRHRGVLVGKNSISLDFMPVSIADSKVAARILSNDKELYIGGSSDFDVNGVTVRRGQGRGPEKQYNIVLPAFNSRKYAFVYEVSPVLRAMAERALEAAAAAEPAGEQAPDARQRANAARGRRPRLVVSENRLEDMLQLLLDARVPLFVPSRARATVTEAARALHEEQQEQPAEQEPEDEAQLDNDAVPQAGDEAYRPAA